MQDGEIVLVSFKFDETSILMWPRNVGKDEGRGGGSGRFLLALRKLSQTSTGCTSLITRDGCIVTKHSWVK